LVPCGAPAARAGRRGRPGPAVVRDGCARRAPAACGAPAARAGRREGAGARGRRLGGAVRGAAGPHCPVRERRRRRAAGAVDRGGLHMRWAAACVGGGQGTLGPGFGAPVHAWAEERGGRARGAAGDRYLLKLFCDFVFHQVRVRDQGRAERLRACWLRRAARGRRPLPAEALPRLCIPPG